MQHQQFKPLLQDWNHTFALWHEQFKNYPHKDQLKDYEQQWKQWQEQMNATIAHLQERLATLNAMVPLSSNQYNSGMFGQYGQYPGQMQQQQQQPSLKPGMQQTPDGVGPRAQGPPPPGPTTVQPPNFTGIGGPRSVKVCFVLLHSKIFLKYQK